MTQAPEQRCCLAHCLPLLPLCNWRAAAMSGVQKRYVQTCVEAEASVGVDRCSHTQMSGAPAATPPAHTGAPSKLDRWLQRSSPQASTVSTPPASDKKEEAPAAAPAAAPPANAGAKSKLDRWLQRSNAPQTPTYTSPHTAVQKPQKGSAQASMVSAVPHDPAKSPITSVGPSGPVTPRADGSTMLPVATPPQEPPATTWCVAPPPASSCSALLLLLAQNRHSQEKCLL